MIVPNYRQTVTPGDVVTYTRARMISLDNSDGVVPSVTYVEEEKTTLPDGRVFYAQAGQLTEAMADPNEVFDLIDPATGAVVGTTTAGQYYAIVYSHYLHAAAKRDAAAQA